jgi:AmiR/NasT family two-component response regulator
LLKRQQPDLVVVALDSDIGQQVAQDMIAQNSQLVWLAIVSQDDEANAVRDQVDGVLVRPFTVHDLLNAIEQALDGRHEAACATV